MTDLMQSVHHVFVYGTLKPGHGAWELIRDEAVAVYPAKLHNFALVQIGNPIVVPSKGEEVDGFLVEFDPNDIHEIRDRLDVYEGVGRYSAYHPQTTMVDFVDDDRTVARVWALFYGAAVKHRSWEPSLDLDASELAEFNRSAKEVLR